MCSTSIVSTAAATAAASNTSSRTHKLIAIFYDRKQARDARANRTLPNGLQVFNGIITALYIVRAKHDHDAHVALVVHSDGHPNGGLQLHVGPSNQSARFRAVGPNHLGAVGYGIDQPRGQDVLVELGWREDGIATRQRLEAVHIRRCQAATLLRLGQRHGIRRHGLGLGLCSEGVAFGLDPSPL
jgi:hypothetical protein